MKTNKHSICFFVACVFMGIAGCGSDQIDCRTLANHCLRAQEQRCTGNMVQTCSISTDNCLRWIDSTSCQGLQLCTFSGTTASCVCNDQCSADQKQCSQNVLQHCVVDSNQCLIWATDTDCGSSNQICAASGNTFVCQASCQSDCNTENAMRCNSQVVQKCAPSGSCLKWTDQSNCTAIAATPYCQETGGTAGCSATCPSTCTTVGATQCNRDTVQTCTSVGANCQQWKDTQDCTTIAATPYCLLSNSVAACSASCQNECPSLNAGHCAGTVLQTCTQAGACLRWSNTKDCNLETTDKFCVESSSTQASCTSCSNTCACEGHLRCSSTFDKVEICKTESGCKHWALQTDCSSQATEKFCAITEDINGNHVGSCVDYCLGECSFGDSRCMDNAVQECAADNRNCYVWQNAPDKNCQAQGQFCHELNFISAECAANCDQSCVVDSQGCGQLLLNDDYTDSMVLFTCQKLGNQCPTWEVIENCYEKSLICIEEGIGVASCQADSSMCTP